MKIHSVAQTSLANLRPWQKGVSGNPGGVPRGKAKLTGDLVNELQKHFEAEGAIAIKRAADEDPVGYLRIIASLVPKDMTVNARPFSEFTDEELIVALEMIQRYLEAGGPPHIGATVEGEAAAVPALPDERG